MEYIILLWIFLMSSPFLPSCSWLLLQSVLYAAIHPTLAFYTQTHAILFPRMGTQLPPGMDLNTTPLIAPPTGIESNFVDPPSLSTVIIAVVSITIILQVFFLSIRVYNDVCILGKVTWDNCVLHLLLDKKFKKLKHERDRHYRSNFFGRSLSMSSILYAFSLFLYDWYLFKQQWDQLYADRGTCLYLQWQRTGLG